jgi:hypothetical protein
LQDFVDQHLISSSQSPAIKPVMGGRFVQQIICRGHDFTSEREEDFYQISVDVKGMGSLQKSLDDYVKVRHVYFRVEGVGFWFRVWAFGHLDFYQISVAVKGMGSLQKSLDDYVKARQLV